MSRDDSTGTPTDQLVVMCGVHIGNGVGLVNDQTFLLVHPDNGRFAEKLWALLERRAEIDELLEELSAHGLRTLGAFAMCRLDGNGARVVVRGEATISVGTPDGDVVVECGAVKTWVEEVFDKVDSVILNLVGDPFGQLPYRVSEGIVPADGLAWNRSLRSAPELEDLDASWTENFTPPEVEALAAEQPAEPVQGSGPVSEGQPEDAPPQPDSAKGVPEVLEQSGMDVDSTPVPRSAEGGQQENDIEDDAEPENPYDSLYGHTIAKSVQHAAVISNEAEEEELPAAGESLPSASTTSSSAVVTGAAGLVEGIPEDGALLGEHDGHTMTKAQLRALREGTAAGAGTPAGTPSMGGPTVQALVCSNNHPSPLHVSTCRVCDIAVAGSPIEIARPTMGRLSFATGEVVVLDKPAIIGRRPQVSGSMMEIPHLVKLDISDTLSRSHAAIRIEGWQVLIEDLGSMHGTIVTKPGRDPQRLHVGEPMLLEDMAVIDFGGVVKATYEEVV